jgi:hypothetical protein
MLSSVLPGIREIRGPIAAGYLWLVFGWLVAGETIPSRAEASGIWGRLYELAPALGSLGYGVAATFAAYLIGSLSMPLFSPVLARVRTALRAWRFDRQHRGRGVPLFRLPSEEPVCKAGVLSGAGSHGLAGYVLAELRRASRDFARQPPDQQYASTVYFEVIAEMRLIERRLIGERTELYEEADRLRAEAELRSAIAPPLVALAGLVAYSIGWLGLLAFPLLALLVAALYEQGQRRLRDRNDLLVDALVLGRVEAPALERWAPRSPPEGAANS